MNCTRASKKLSWVKGVRASAWRFTGTPETFAKASSPSLPLKAMFCSWHASTHSCAWRLSRWARRGPDAVDSAYGCTLMERLFWWSFLWKLSAKYGGKKGKKTHRQNVHCLVPLMTLKNWNVSSPELASLVPALWAPLWRCVGLPGSVVCPWWVRRPGPGSGESSDPGGIFPRSNSSSWAEGNPPCIKFAEYWIIKFKKTILTWCKGWWSVEDRKGSSPSSCCLDVTISTYRLIFIYLLSVLILES